MTESQAWKILAIELAERRVKTKWMCITLEAGPPLRSMMYANDAVLTIPYALRRCMIERIEAHLADDDDEIFCQGAEMDYEESIDARVLACLVFSEMLKEES